MTELRHGRALCIQAPDGHVLLVASVEMLSGPAWQHWCAMPGDWQLFLSAQRVASLGGAASASIPDLPTIDTPGHEHPWAMPLDVGCTGLDELWRLAGLDLGRPVEARPDGLKASAEAAVDAALVLARLGRLAPALIGCRLARPADPALAPWLEDCLKIEAETVLLHAAERPVSLEKVSEAPVPLADADDCRFVLFREVGSDFEHVAVIVGQSRLKAGDPVRVRLHSSCLTGDLFGSLRCDCGDQLRGTVARLAAGGGGIVLYLSQEGRGIGLANKLRAYVRQDQGLDTLDANHSLGFRSDERHFEVAAGILQQLGHERIHLLTNNPAKIAALSRAGIEIVEREAVLGEVNPHNQRYLATKLRRGGHLFDEDGLQVP